MIFRIFGSKYGTKEAFAAKPQVKHLLAICPNAHIQIFPGMNHGQLLVDHPDGYCHLPKALFEFARKAKQV